MITLHLRLKALSAVCAIVVALPAGAQVQRSGGGENQRFMQQYQQIAAEKTALQAQLAQMQKDLDAARADLAAAKKERDAFKARAGTSAASGAAIAQLTSAKESAEKNLEISKNRMNELVERFRQTAGNLKESENERNTLRKNLDERSAAFDKCAENNMQLYEISQEVLNRYEHVGVFTKVSATEPFTGITRTRIENLVDEYRARALENRTPKTGH